MAIRKGILFFKDGGTPINGTSAAAPIRSDWINLENFNGQYILYFNRTLTTGNPRLNVEITDGTESGATPLSSETTNIKIPATVTKIDAPFGKIRIDYTPNGATGDITFILQKVIED